MKELPRLSQFLAKFASLFLQNISYLQMTKVGENKSLTQENKNPTNLKINAAYLNIFGNSYDFHVFRTGWCFTCQ